MLKREKNYCKIKLTSLMKAFIINIFNSQFKCTANVSLIKKPYLKQRKSERKRETHTDINTIREFER